LQTLEVQIEGLEDDVKRYTILSDADAVQGVQLEKAKLGLKSAKVQRATLLEQISKTSIKAPFNGVVTAKLNEEGGFAAPGIPLIQITDINTLRFTINVPEKDLIQFQTNKSYSINSDVYPEIPLTGKIIMTGSKANMGNSFPVQFQVENTKNQAIKSGMFGKVNLSSTLQEQGILIPSSAIIEENNVSKVYAVKNGKAVLQTITTSKNIGNKTLVSNGLKENDIIVTNGFINLFDGANLLIKN
jgi:RND family efflux transporter MFP subunit